MADISANIQILFLVISRREIVQILFQIRKHPSAVFLVDDMFSNSILGWR